MSELETLITEWRARMTEALPKSDETVAELEEHLREHVADLCAEGKPDEEAFALAQARIGEPYAIAREFERIPGRWRPGLVALPLIALYVAFNTGFNLWNISKRFPLSPLPVASYAALAIVYFGTFGAGVVASSAFLKTWWRPLSERERRAVRRCLGNLALLAGLFLLLSWALHAMWLAELTVNRQAVWPFDLRRGAAIISVALLIVVHSRSATSDRVHWLAAIFPFLVLVFGSLPPFVCIADIPVRWVCVALLLAQVWLALPRFRVHIERLHETN